MQYCRICHCIIKPDINIFQETLGDPPVPIIELINDCTQDYLKSDDFCQRNHNLSYICLKCSGKLLLYYKAKLMIKKIKEEMYALIENAVDLPETTANDVIEVDETDCCSIINFDDRNGEEIKFEVGNDTECNEEDQIKIEIIGNADELIEEVEGELVLDDITAVLKAEVLEQTLSSDEKNSILEEIEFEKLNVDVDEYPPKKGRIKIGKRIPLREPVRCSDCALVFKGKRAYTAHRRQKHFAGFVCDQCGKTFYSQSGFIAHKHSHKPEKEFVCPVCGEGYHHKGYLNRHMAWHSGEMPFQCDICSKQFRHKVALYRHKKIHEDIRNIECTQCSFKFRTKAHLNRHMMTHTGAKPHSCPICGKCFSQVYNMKVHIREHESPGSTRRTRIKCKKCSKTFSRQQRFDYHIQQNQCQ